MSNIIETQYDETCETCDALIKQNIKEPNRIANNWLHVIRYHPIHLKDYKPIFEINNSLKFYFFLFKKACLYFALSVKRILDIFSQKLLEKGNIKIENHDYESIFISHLLKPEYIHNRKDFYFHELPEKFQDSQKKSLIVNINHSKIKSSLLNNQIKNINKIVLPKYLSIFKELQISFFLLKEATVMLLTESPEDSNSRFKLQAAIEFMSPASHFNFRIGKQIKDLVKQLKVNYIFTTFEGHAFERIVFSNARKSNKSIKCIGYQHALISRKQHAIKRKLGINYDPDFILTSGNDGKEKMINSGLINEKKIFLLGTNRTSEKKILFKEKRNTFLVLPEGDLIECFPFVDLLFELAKLLPTYHFIIRFHPITDIMRLKKERTQLINPPKNITISDTSFDNDLKRSDFAVYGGSTTIIKAIENGLIPIYYNKKGGQNIDPLFLLSNYKKSIKDLTDIYDVINIDEDENIKNLNVLNLGIKQFFSPLNYNEALKLKKLN